MSVAVQGKAQLAISFNNEPAMRIPLEAIPSLHLISNVKLIGPMFEITIVDMGGTLLNPMPSDGTPIDFYVGDGSTQPRRYTMRCLGSPSIVDTPRGKGIRIVGVYRHELFFSVASKSSIGTSSEAISEVAQRCGLSLSNAAEDVDTNRVDRSLADSMKWLPQGKKYGHFLADIAAHGWFGSESAASVVGVSLDGQVCYRDLGKLAKAEVRHKLYYQVPCPPSDSSYLATSAELSDLSPVTTGQFGYGASLSGFDIDGQHVKHDKVRVTLNNNTLNMGSDVKAAVGIGRVVLLPPDCGNTHANYARAGYQNTRYRATFSNEIALLIPQQTNGLDLTDPALVYTLNELTRDTVETRGVISARTISVINGYYCERYNVSYQGVERETRSVQV